MMKEFSTVGSLSGQYKSKLEIETLVFSSMQSGQVERTYGLKITVQTSDNSYPKDGTCLIDQDELTELSDGLRYLDDKLMQLSTGVQNYTELQYVTRDGFRIGFFVNPGPSPNPTVFCSVPTSDSAFMPSVRLSQIRELIQKGQEVLNQLAF